MQRAPEPKLTWSQTKSIIKPKFRDAGITKCELKPLKFTNKQGKLICTGGGDSFAHSMRRTEIAKIKDIKVHNQRMAEVIVACLPCHIELDSLAHNKTTNIVRKIIRDRIIPIK